jgi:hypothetical protein
LASTYPYHASALCHKPLYFEEVQLERYGHPPASGSRLSVVRTVIGLAAALSDGDQPADQCDTVGLLPTRQLHP